MFEMVDKAKAPRKLIQDTKTVELTDCAENVPDSTIDSLCHEFELINTALNKRTQDLHGWVNTVLREKNREIEHLHEHLLKEQIRNIKLQDHVFELNTINERHQIDV